MEHTRVVFFLSIFVFGIFAATELMYRGDREEVPAFESHATTSGCPEPNTRFIVRPSKTGGWHVFASFVSEYAQPVVRATVSAYDRDESRLALYSATSVDFLTWCEPGMVCVGFDVPQDLDASRHTVRLTMEYEGHLLSVQGPLESTRPSFVGLALGTAELSTPPTRHHGGSKLEHDARCASRETAGWSVLLTTTSIASAHGAWVRTNTAARVLSDEILPRQTCDNEEFAEAEVAYLAKNASQRLRWIDQTGCAPRLLSGAEVRRCASRLVFMGDSVVRQMHLLLNCTLGNTSPHQYIAIKNFFPNLLDETLEYLRLANGGVPRPPVVARRRRLASFSRGYIRHATPKKNEHTVIINAAGLWQCAYGELDEWADGVAQTLTRAKRDFKRVIWLQTTAVHPVQMFGDDYSCTNSRHNETEGSIHSKRSMTESRIELLNAIAADVARKHDVPVVDTWSPSSLRDDDPIKKGDMRHYGIETVSALLTLVLDAACNS